VRVHRFVERRCHERNSTNLTVVSAATRRWCFHGSARSNWPPIVFRIEQEASVVKNRSRSGWRAGLGKSEIRAFDDRRGVEYRFFRDAFMLSEAAEACACFLHFGTTVVCRQRDRSMHSTR